MTQIDHWNILSPAKKCSSYTIIKFKRARLDFSKTSYTINQSKNSFKLKRIQNKKIDNDNSRNWNKTYAWWKFSIASNPDAERQRRTEKTKQRNDIPMTEKRRRAKNVNSQMRQSQWLVNATVYRKHSWEKRKKAGFEQKFNGKGMGS